MASAWTSVVGKTCKQAVAHGQLTKPIFEKTRIYIDKIIRDLRDSVGISGGIEKIKIDKSLILLVGPAGLEPGTRPL